MTASPPPPARRPPGARLRRAALWLAGFLALVAVVGFFIAPPVIRSQAEKILSRELGRTTTLEEVKVNPFAPSLTVRGFNIREADGTQPFVTFDELYVRASYTSLFRFAPVVDQVKLARPQVRIVRTAAARFNFSDIQERLAARPKNDAPPDAEPARFAVYNIEVLDGSIEVDDRVVSRRLGLTDIDVGLPFVSSLPSQREVFVEPRFSAKLNGAPLEARAKSKPFHDTRESTLNFELADLDVVPFVAYSPTRLPVDLKAAKLDLDLDVTFAQPAGKAPAVVVAGRTDLKGIAVDFPAGGPLLRLASVATELAAIEPLSNRYEVAKVRVVSPEVWVKRDKDGKFLLAPLFTAPEPARGGPAAQPAAAKPVAYRLDELTVEGGLVHAVDERGSRPIQLEYRDLRAAVRNVSSAAGAKLTFEASTVTDLEERIALDGEATLEPLDVGGTVRLEKVSLPRLWPLAEPFLVAELTAGQLGAGTRFRYAAKGGEPYLALDDIEVSLADVSLRQPRARQEFLKLASLDVRGGAFDLVERRLAIGQVTSKALRLSAVREKDGRIDLERLLPPRDAAAGAPAAKDGAEKPFLVEVKKLSVDAYAIRVEDRTRADPFTLALEPLQATVENFSTAAGARANAALKVTVNRKGTLAASGPFGINPVNARLKVDARTIDIALVQRLLDEYVNAAITSGLLSSRGEVRVEMPPGRPLRAQFAGDVTLADFGAVDKTSRDDLLKWKSLFVGDIDFDLEPLKVNVKEVALADFYSRLIINPDGTLNLQHVLARPGDEGASTTSVTSAPKPAAAPPATAASVDDLSPRATASGGGGPTAAALPPRATPTAGGLPPNVRVGRITLQGGNVNFSDFFIKPNFSANLTGIGGSVTEITPDKPGDVELRGKVDNTAPVEIGGRVNPLARDLFLDIKASARDIELPPLSPYSIKYAGYGIQKGKLSVNLKYLVENRKLSAENNVYLDQLTFGEKVESPTATKLPVLLAVSLLKDRNGVIDIDLPISGSLDDPQFSVGGIIVRVIVNLITKVITAPFAALASAFGGKEELSYVEYAAGSARLDDDDRKRLDTLGKALVDRPALRLEVAGRVAPEQDREALKRAYVDGRVKAQKAKQLAREGKPPASLDDVTVAKEEYVALLKSAYGEEKFPKPRNAIGFTKDLPVPEMENLMITHAQVTEEDLRQLANRRAQAAKDYLVDAAKVPADRVFLVAPVVGGEAPADKGPATRAAFSLK